MANNEMFIVQSANPDRLYVKVYHDFLDSTVISGKEKLVLILLKRYLNFRDDKIGIEGSVYPTLNTLSKQASLSKKTLISILHELEQKGLITITQRGQNQPNIYTIKDFQEIWKATTGKEVKDVIARLDNENEEKHMIEYLRQKGYTVTKEKRLATAEPTKVTADTSTNKNQNGIINGILNFEKSQEYERYTLKQICNIYEYEVMMHDYKEDKEEIETVINLLHKVLNSQKKTIRVNETDMTCQVVISKLLKLTREEIIYSIKKFKENAQHVINSDSYLLTLLYNAKEQMSLDIVKKMKQYNE